MLVRMDSRTDTAHHDLARALLRAPSPSGREGPATRAFTAALRELGYDEVRLDAAGNALGVLRRGDGPTVLLNGHLDTVPVGDEAAWAHPPLGGACADGELWGRGAVDMKAALACMAHAGADAAAAGFRGTLVVAGVVQEEVGGLGSRHLAETLDYDVVVLGEPSGLELRLGHRGRIELEIALPGRIAHAAKAELGANALDAAADFLEALRGLELPGDGPLGRSTATPTNLRSFPETSANVVPGGARLVVDYRNVPGDEPEAVRARLAELAPDARVTIPEEHAVSEDGGLTRRFPRVAPPYLAPSDDPFVALARASLRATLAAADRPFREGTWWFCTDAPYLASRGAPVVGFGPGDPELAHTTRERVPLAHLDVARDAYAQLALAFSRRGVTA